MFKGKSDRKSAKVLAEKDREPPSSGEGIFPCGVGLRSYGQGLPQGWYCCCVRPTTEAD